MQALLRHENHEFDVCVIGGGMAGLCAAISSARHGARTALVHDRPVLGGNASSEIRMWICGAQGPHNKETGLLEETQLENQYRNPAANYSVWDGVLWQMAWFQPGLELFLNCACTDAAMASADRIESIRAWELTSQTWRTFHAKHFIDCSGDSILAAVTGAEFRQGREARGEFDEDIQPPAADRKTMGNSLLIQVRRTDEAQPFIAPRWAYRFETEADLPHRMEGVNAHNFWWLEVGGLRDTLADAESIRDELMRIGYGVWDYIKNRAPKRAQAENWALEWIGSLPGKRENRRFVGDHILTQNDVRAGGDFHDLIAYGGWSMDDHHPAGLLYPGEPTIFHPAPSPYGIPYRCLYSKNIGNLFFAGRNISVTHAALSSTRVMGTTAMLGQAAGTAAALCVRGRQRAARPERRRTPARVDGRRLLAAGLPPRAVAARAGRDAFRGRRGAGSFARRHRARPARTRTRLERRAGPRRRIPLETRRSSWAACGWFSTAISSYTNGCPARIRTAARGVAPCRNRLSKATGWRRRMRPVDGPSCIGKPTTTNAWCACRCRWKRARCVSSRRKPGATPTRGFSHSSPWNLSHKNSPPSRKVRRSVKFAPPPIRPTSHRPIPKMPGWTTNASPTLPRFAVNALRVATSGGAGHFAADPTDRGTF